MTRQEKIDEIAEKAELNVEEQILDILLPPPRAANVYDFDPTAAETQATQRLLIQPATPPGIAPSSFSARVKSYAVSFAAANSTAAWLKLKFARRTFR